MKKLATVVFAMLLTGSLAFAQATTATPNPDQKTTETGTKAHKGKKSHKGGKKSKKNSTETTATPK